MSTHSNLQDQIADKTEDHGRLPLELQQMILNVYKAAFPVLEAPATLSEDIQKVKGHLFNRDFLAAFGEQANLEAYAVRWSAARSLAYTSIFLKRNQEFALGSASQVTRNDAQRVSDKSDEPGEANTEVVSSAEEGRPELRIVCVGGGAGAEVVSLAAAHRHAQTKMVITAIDITDWSVPVSKLAAAVYEPPKLSTRASEAAKARPENQPLLKQTDLLEVAFQQQDALTWDKEVMKQILERASLCTIMFTLNELFSASLQKTTSFLLNLTSMMMSGSCLLIVDSPGSYSEIQLQNPKTEQSDKEREGASKKKYPMKWLLDHTLLTVAKNGDESVWDKVEDEDSLWFRIDAKDREKLRYPLELENMRYQLHLYRRI